jgi:hypothetical protein
LGLFGLKKGEPFPSNYMKHNVMSELSSFRKASRIHKPFVDNAVLRWGSNHS